MTGVSEKEIRKWWISNPFVGACKRKLLSILQKKYQFKDWHLSPINERPYAQEVIFHVQEYIERTGATPVVEVGCGLASILGNLKVPNAGQQVSRIGVDISTNNLAVAKILHPTIDFIEGSFDSVRVGKIGCLIMVNFLHRISEEDLLKEMRALLERNTVDLIVFDSFTGHEAASWVSHNGDILFDGKYKLIRKSRGFATVHGIRRHIEYWEKI